jgi:hypothetical protein
MAQAIFSINLIGLTDLLMHANNIDFQARVKRWQKDVKNKPKQVPGDDRSPAFTYMGYIYEDHGLFAIPSDNLQTCLREGGTKVETGKRGATFKRLTQSGMLVNEVAWPILVNGKQVSSKAYKDGLEEEEDFQLHEEKAKKFDFTLFVKCVRVGKARNIRVRPRFTNWSAEGTVTVHDDKVISQETLQQIFTAAGSLAGLGDWRPSSPVAPGPWGRFTAEVTRKA